MSKEFGIGKYCIIRTYSAGVHAGILKSRDEKEGVLNDSRRIWYWDGAASLSELAAKGTAKPDKCKFPCAVQSMLIREIIEVIPCSEEAEKSIRSVPEWSGHE